MVTKAIRDKSKEYLLQKQVNHSKSINLDISDDPQEYLTNDEMTLEEKKLLFQLRRRMIDIKENFKSRYNGDNLCEFCKSDAETFIHLPQCEVLKADPNVGELLTNIEPDDIYRDVEQVKSVKA